jgi:hypothetical protein
MAAPVSELRRSAAVLLVCRTALQHVESIRKSRTVPPMPMQAANHKIALLQAAITNCLHELPEPSRKAILQQHRSAITDSPLVVSTPSRSQQSASHALRTPASQVSTRPGSSFASPSSPSSAVPRPVTSQEALLTRASPHQLSDEARVTPGGVRSSLRAAFALRSGKEAHSAIAHGRLTDSASEGTLGR